MNKELIAKIIMVAVVVVIGTKYRVKHYVPLSHEVTPKEWPKLLTSAYLPRMDISAGKRPYIWPNAPRTHSGLGARIFPSNCTKSALQKCF